MAKVSIILCVYKGEQYIRECIDSVLRQTYKNIELLIVDDGSPDNCPSICDEYAKKDSRVRIIHKKNAGLGFARNTGLANVTGDYVTFIDQDDWMAKNCIERLYETAESTRSELVVCGLYRYFSENRIIEIKETFEQVSYINEDVKKYCLAPIIGADEENPIDVEREMCVFRNLYRKNLIDQIGAKFESEREYLSDDLFFNLRYISSCIKATIIPDCLYYYRANETSMTAKLSENEYAKDEALYLKAKEIAEEKGVTELLGNRLERMFLTKVRRTLILVVASSMSKRAKLKEIHRILNETVLVDVFKWYPIRGFSFSKKIMALCMKMRLPLCVYLITTIHNIKE